MVKAFIGVAVATSLFAFAVTAEETTSRYYLGIGEPSPDAWQIMIENPTYREKDMGLAIETIGGEMISYFWGLADGKNYITVRLPDDPGQLLQAAQSGAAAWLDGDYQAMRFAPAKLTLKPGEGPPHIRLDRAAQFLIGDRI